MIPSTSVSIFTSLAVFSLAITAQAALPPMSPQDLETSAQLVVDVTITSIDTSKEGTIRYSDQIYLLQGIVTKVFSGQGFKEGDTISIRCWHALKRPNGWAGPSGHFGIPSLGDQARFYLNPWEEASIWSPLTPNGIELLAEAPEETEADDEEGAPARRGLFERIFGRS